MKSSFRFDKAASIYVFRPFKKMITGGKKKIPILMYHSISDNEEASVHPYYMTHTSPEIFAAQMKFLYEMGYAVISMPDAEEKLGRGWDGKENYVVLTFDDGFLDFYTNAFPVLMDYGFTATVFLPTAFIGDGTLSFKNKRCLCWREVRELRKSGITFGSHTVTHPQLRELRFELIAQELNDSRKAIEDNLGEPVQSFSYPYRFPEEDRSFRRYLRDTLREAGYSHGVTTVIGRARMEDDKLFLKRLPVNGADDLDLFSAKLEGGYDWVHKPQIISKQLKKLLLPIA